MPITKQCLILELSRSSVYYMPAPVSDKDRELMRLIDEIHLEEPYLGSRGMKCELQSRGHNVGRIHVRTLMRKMGIEALEEAIAQYGTPGIFNTDHGNQFTSLEFTNILINHNIRISMDGQGRWSDNVFIERPWKTVKYQEVYLKAYESITHAKKELRKFFDRYNIWRRHQGLSERA